MRVRVLLIALATLAVSSCGPSKPVDPKLSVVGAWQGADNGNGVSDRSLMVFNSNRTFGFYQGTTMVGTWEQTGQSVLIYPTGRVDRWDIRNGATPPGNQPIGLMESDNGLALSSVNSGTVMFTRSHSRK